MSSYVQEAIQRSGINRTELVAVCAYLIRTKQASGQIDAIEQLAAGKYDGIDLNETLIKSFQVELEEEEIVEEEVTPDDELRTLMANSTE